MTSPAALAALAVGVLSAEPVAPHTTRFALGGSLGAVGLSDVGFRAVPTLGLEATFAYGVAAGCDVRLAMRNTNGLESRVGAEVRVRFARAGRWVFGFRARPEVGLLVVPLGTTRLQAELSATAMLLTGFATRDGMLSFEAGAAAVFLASSAGGGRQLVDTRPLVSVAQFAASYEWRRTGGRTLGVQLEVGIAPRPDPLSFFGTYPRLSLVGTWGL